MGSTYRIDASWEDKNGGMKFAPAAEVDYKKANKCLARIDDLLLEVGEIINHRDRESEIEKVFDDYEKLRVFVAGLTDMVLETVDEPLYEAFNKGMTEDISRIKLENYTAPNTINAKRRYKLEAGDKTRMVEENPKELNLLDFMGLVGVKGESDGTTLNLSISPELDKFVGLFEDDYEALKNSNDKFKDITTEQYLNIAYRTGEFFHEKDQPFRQLMSNIADATVIVPLIEACIGYDFITNEDLSYSQIEMKTLAFGLGLFSFGSAGEITVSIEQLLKFGGRELIVNMAANGVSYTISELCEELNLPAPLSMILTALGGLAVAYTGGRWSGKVFDNAKVANDIKANPQILKLLKDAGMTPDEYLKLLKQTTYSVEDIAKIKAIRDLLTISSDTNMTKVIPIEDIDKYIDGTYEYPRGYMVRTDDLMDIKRYEDIVEALRLDYTKPDGTRPFQDGGNSYAKIEFPAGENVDNIHIPYGKEFGGTTVDNPPFTGNGYTSSRNNTIVPENKADEIIYPDGAKIVEVKDGKDKLIAIYSESEKRFNRVKVRRK